MLLSHVLGLAVIHEDDVIKVGRPHARESGPWSCQLGLLTHFAVLDYGTIEAVDCGRGLDSCGSAFVETRPLCLSRRVGLLSGQWSNRRRPWNCYSGSAATGSAPRSPTNVSLNCCLASCPACRIAGGNCCPFGSPWLFSVAG